MPGLRHTSVLHAMSRAVADVYAALSALQDLGPCPDHELVDSSRALIAYEALLHEAKARLEKVYRTAMEGRDLEEAEGKDESAAAGAEAGDAAVHEEVVAVLKQAEEGKLVENVRLMDRNLRCLPEAFGRIQGLRVLDVSHNQLQYAHLYQ
ncbi:hypothetical protein ACQ4PT_025840 [Festuca glaucescens]